MRKTLFEGTESNLLISKQGDEVLIEMIDKDVSLSNIQLGDSYNNIILNKEDVLYLGQLLLHLLSNEE
jgi:hypothetical protein